MTTTTMMAKLRAVIFGGAVVLLPYAASAEDAPSVPDHAQAEDRGGAETTIPTAEKTPGPPDHAQAEDRGGAETTIPAAEKAPGVPDHAQAEDRGATPQK